MADICTNVRINCPKIIEKVQMKATKYMCRIKHLSYEDGLQHLRLPALNYRRIRDDMTELYKIITGKYYSNCGLWLYLRSDTVHASVTRGNNFKLVPQHCRYDLIRYYFTNRVVPIWQFT